MTEEKEARTMEGQKQSKDRTTEREVKKRHLESLASTLPSLLASAADVVVRKGGINVHKVIIIHMNADQILENCKYTHTHTLAYKQNISDLVTVRLRV